MGLVAGVAREVISPPRGLYLIGYGDRSKGNTGILDDLTATALVLDDGQRRLAVVACDLLCLNEFVVDCVRTGAGAGVIICCSHTHAGPIAYAGERCGRRRAYIDGLIRRLGRAVSRAAAGLAPAELSWAQGEADIAVNRRERQADGRVTIGCDPGGAVDRSLGVLRVCRPDGAPLAVVINYACHGTVLGPDNLLVSADWVGPMRKRVESELGAPALFLQGAAGNLNPAQGWEGERSWALARAQGERVAERAIEACRRRLEPVAGTPLGLARREVWLPLEADAATPTPPRSYRGPVLRGAGLPPWVGPLADWLLDRRYPWRSRIEARAGRWHVPLRVNAARLGEVALVTFAAETFTEIGLAVKDASPAAHTMFASVSDGCIGYLPTAAAHAEGGYEVDLAPFFYRYPGRLAAGCDALAVGAARQAQDELWGGASRPGFPGSVT